MQRTKRVAVGLIAVPLSALLLAACGKSGSDSSAKSTSAPKDNGVAALTGDDILKKATDATKAQKSLHLAGNIEDSNSKVDVDVTLQENRAVGRVTTDGKAVEITRIDDALYIRANDDYWSSFGGQAAANLFRGKTVQTTVHNEKFGQVGIFTDRSEFFNQVLSPAGSVTKGDSTDVNGNKAIQLLDKDSGEGGALYVSTTGDPVLLRLDSTGAPAESGTAKIDFTYPDTQINPPPADQVVDLDQLQQRK